MKNIFVRIESEILALNRAKDIEAALTQLSLLDDGCDIVFQLANQVNYNKEEIVRLETKVTKPKQEIKKERAQRYDVQARVRKRPVTRNNQNPETETAASRATRLALTKWIISVQHLFKLSDTAAVQQIFFEQPSN